MSAPKRQRLTAPDDWTAAGWLSSIPAVTKVIADQLSPSSLDRLLQWGKSPSGRDDLLTHLQQRGTLEKLVDYAIWPAAQALSNAEAATASELTEKIVQQGVGFDLGLGHLSSFYGGLEAIVGPPDPKIDIGMEREHCVSADSTVTFTTPNYGIVTTSQIEYYYVVDPSGGLVELGIAEYPREDPAKLTGNAVPRESKPLTSTISSLRQAFDDKNVALERLGQTRLLQCEMTAGRLYTGPLYVKYNGALRGLQLPAVFAAQLTDLCRSNKYTTYAAEQGIINR
jgi:hypothetical protein